MKIKKESVISVLICVILSCLVALGIQYSYSFYRDFPSANVKFYDSKLEEGKNGWVGPKIGEKIDLTSLTDVRGKTLQESHREKLIMILVINPQCIVCQSSTDQMKQLEDQSNQNKIDFVVASFNSQVSLSDVQKFTDFAELTSTAYTFAGDETDISPSTKGYSIHLTFSQILTEQS